MNERVSVCVGGGRHGANCDCKWLINNEILDTFWGFNLLNVIQCVRVCVLCGMHCTHKSVSWFYCCHMCTFTKKHTRPLIVRTHSTNSRPTHILHISIVFAFWNCLFDTTEYADNYSILFLDLFLTVGNCVYGYNRNFGLLSWEKRTTRYEKILQ